MEVGGGLVEVGEKGKGRDGRLMVLFLRCCLLPCCCGFAGRFIQGLGMRLRLGRGGRREGVEDGEVVGEQMIRMTPLLLIQGNGMGLRNSSRAGGLDFGAGRQLGPRLGIWLVERGIRDNRTCHREEVDGLVVVGGIAAGGAVGEVVALRGVDRAPAHLLDMKVQGLDQHHGDDGKSGV